MIEKANTSRCINFVPKKVDVKKYWLNERKIDLFQNQKLNWNKNWNRKLDWKLCLK